MKNIYFKVIIIISIFCFLLVSNSHVFASSIVNDNVTVQQDVSFYANRDIENVRSFISTHEDLYDYLVGLSSTRYYAISPSDSGVINLYLFLSSNVAGTGSDINYYGVLTTSFVVNRYSVISLYRDSWTVRSPVTTSIELPSVYYYRTYNELIYNITFDNPVVSSVDNNTNAVNSNTNAVKENTEVSQETQNFIKDESQVEDSSITSMTDSFSDLDDVQDTGSEDIGNIFNLFSNNRNLDGQPFIFSVHVPFSNEVMNIRLDNNLTRDILLDLCGGRTGTQTLVITCFEFVWSFFIFKFIVANMISLIDKIRTGDITNIRTRNVLVDVL